MQEKISQMLHGIFTYIHHNSGLVNISYMDPYGKVNSSFCGFLSREWIATKGE